MTNPASLSAAYHAARTHAERNAVLRCMARRAQRAHPQGFDEWIGAIIELLTPEPTTQDQIEMAAVLGSIEARAAEYAGANMRVADISVDRAHSTPTNIVATVTIEPTTAARAQCHVVPTQCPWCGKRGPASDADKCEERER